MAATIGALISRVFGIVSFSSFFDMYACLARGFGPWNPNVRNDLIRSRLETGPSFRLIWLVEGDTTHYWYVLVTIVQFQ